MAALRRTFPGRRGPCYQTCGEYMLHRTREVEKFGAFPPPAGSQHGSDAHPGQDSRRFGPQNVRRPVYPCIACAGVMQAFVHEQHRIAGQVVREMVGEEVYTACSYLRGSVR